jgi:pantoate--beta-alanine ligase
MKIFKDKQSLQKVLFKDKNVSFIPTMGSLHKGHLSLIKKSIKYKRKVLVSIFVNPKQFNKKSDFKSYPRNIDDDIKKLSKFNVDYLYLPPPKDIYGFKVKKKIFLDKFEKVLCGKYRKGHFRGVVDVVNRFLEIIKPKFIFLGLKDFQQLYLIKKHILKNKIKTKVVECKIIRERNGLVYSSRNVHLNKEQIKIASNIYKFLSKFKKKLRKKYTFPKKNILRKIILDLGANKIDYIESYNIKTLKFNRSSSKYFKIFIAYYIKKVRLIDNI